MAANQQSTRKILDKFPSFSCLYRHRVNGFEYGAKRISGKRKEHSLKTTERKLAERKLKGWIADLDTVDEDAAKTTLSSLLDKFVTPAVSESVTSKPGINALQG